VSAFEIPLRPQDEWKDHGECRGHDPRLWDGYQTRKNGPMLFDIARDICTSCPVRGFCLEDAIENGEVAGMRGGLTPHEYTQLARQRRRFAHASST
jgi:WhiB family redox-sensing transcriptional regulator